MGYFNTFQAVDFAAASVQLIFCKAPRQKHQSKRKLLHQQVDLMKNGLVRGKTWTHRNLHKYQRVMLTNGFRMTKIQKLVKSEVHEDPSPPDTEIGISKGVVSTSNMDYHMSVIDG